MAELFRLLAVHEYPCTAEKPLIAPTLVLLHGWGCDSSTWLPLLSELQKITDVKAIDLPGFGSSPVLDHFSLDALIAQLEPHIPARAVVMGWSLGGMLAVHLAKKCAQKITAIITLAANVKFVVAADYAAAMPIAVNENFNQNFVADARATLRIFNNLLAQGDTQERNLLKKLRTLPTLDTNKNWLDTLLLLTQLDNRSAFELMTQSGLHLFAENDALVPIAAATAMRTLNPQQNIIVIDGSAHALHWAQTEQVVDHIRQFLVGVLPGKDSEPAASLLLDKKKIAQSFSRAAQTYDAVAGLQRTVGGELFSRLPAQLADETVVVDLGSGTGFFSTQLAAHFPTSVIVGVDIAEGMVRYSAQQHGDGIQWLCGDAEYFPLADHSVDLIFSSLAIQWCNQLPQLMRELLRILKPGGQLFLSTLGPNTLHELKSAWEVVDDYVHVNRFAAQMEVQSALENAGFIAINIHQQRQVIYFNQLVNLTRELKQLGAHNINDGKPAGLTGNARLTALKHAYEHYRTSQGLPATYDVIYITAKNPQRIP